EFGQALPEVAALSDAPLMQLGVILQRQAELPVHMAAEAVHPAVGNAFGGWYPERVGHAATPVLSCSCAGLCRSSLGFTLAPFAAGAPLLRVTRCMSPALGANVPGRDEHQ